MKIAICSSMAFAREMWEAKEGLERLMHQVVIQEDIKEYLEGRRTDEDKWRKLQIDPLRAYYQEIKGSDAILVINKEKRAIPNYIGGNTLIEMAFAYVLEKKIFLLNPIPQMPYSDEIAAMKPVVIHGDLTLIR